MYFNSISSSSLTLINSSQFEYDREGLSEVELRRQIRRIDKDRARYYADCTGQTWGDKYNYDLCVNTTGQKIPDLVARLERLI